jgi:hypothetical protein
MQITWAASFAWRILLAPEDSGVLVGKEEVREVQSNTCAGWMLRDIVDPVMIFIEKLQKRPEAEESGF